MKNSILCRCICVLLICTAVIFVLSGCKNEIEDEPVRKTVAEQLLGGNDRVDSEETESTEKESEVFEEIVEVSGNEVGYVLNKNSKKFHKADCNSVKQMKEENKQNFDGTRDEVISMGYDPCKNCRP